MAPASLARTSPSTSNGTTASVDLPSPSNGAPRRRAHGSQAAVEDVLQVLGRKASSHEVTEDLAASGVFRGQGRFRERSTSFIVQRPGDFLAVEELPQDGNGLLVRGLDARVEGEKESRRDALFSDDLRLVQGHLA